MSPKFSGTFIITGIIDHSRYLRDSPETSKRNQERSFGEIIDPNLNFWPFLHNFDSPWIELDYVRWRAGRTNVNWEKLKRAQNPFAGYLAIDSAIYKIIKICAIGTIRPKTSNASARSTETPRLIGLKILIKNTIRFTQKATCLFICRWTATSFSAISNRE